LGNLPILITGATGFIGTRLTKRLIRKKQIVRAIARTTNSTYTAPHLTWVIGNLSEPSFLLSATQNVSTVIHLASVVPDSSNFRDIWSVNVIGTKNLLEACEYNNVKKFIYISSVAAYAPPLASVVSEDARLGGVEVYGKSKTNAEYLVKKSIINSIILRPCQVYGEGDFSSFTDNLIKLLNLPILPIAHGEDNSFSLVHVDDLVDAIMRATYHPSAIGNVYNIAGSEPTTLEEIAKQYCNLNGHLQLRIPVPSQLLRLLLTTRWHLSNIKRKDLHLASRSYAKDKLHGSIFLGGPKYDILKAQRDIGYQPTITLAVGLSRLIINSH
jgi:nucleoside-diphosphate-sugar epimerase